jgi:small subunit ribosomal protein S15
MTVTKQNIQELVKEFGSKSTDTGAPAVQIAILTSEIENLKDHLLEHKKDNHSRRGILKMVAKRRKLLSYIKRVDVEKYELVLKKLSLRK